MTEVYGLEDGRCPHCGSDDIAKNPAMGDWSCRDCGGSKHTEPPNVMELVQMGCTPAEAVDWIAVVAAGRTQTEWAEARDRDPSTVSENKNKAGAKLRSSARLEE